MTDLAVDAHRYVHYDPSTGIYVRAQHADGSWESVDIITLTKDSLLAWLRSRGGENAWAENTVGILLGHGHLVTDIEPGLTTEWVASRCPDCGYPEYNPVEVVIGCGRCSRREHVPFEQT